MRRINLSQSIISNCKSLIGNNNRYRVRYNDQPTAEKRIEHILSLSLYDL